MRLHNLLADYNSAIMTSSQQLPLDGYSASVIETCSSGNTAQMIGFVEGQIVSHDGLCLVGDCFNCYPARFDTCTTSTTQQFVYSQTASTFVNVASGLCLDLFGGTGPSVGVWNCSGSTWQ
jgi:hypothetical protein